MRRLALVAALVAAALALLAAEVAAGGRSYGATPRRDPCHPPPAAVAAQRPLLRTLDGAACATGVSRERLVLSLVTGRDLGGFVGRLLQRLVRLAVPEDPG